MNSLATHFNIFWIQKQAFTHYCHLHEPSLAKQILIVCDKILLFHTQRGYQFLFLDYFIIFLFFFLLFYVIINFYKNYFIIIILLYFFSLKLFLFFHVPECSGMFRHVPCSGFYRRPFTKAWSMQTWIPVVSSMYFWKSVFSFRVDSGCLNTRLLSKT